MARSLPRLLAISDRRLLGKASIGGWAASLLAAGVDGLQVREKDLVDRRLAELTRQIRACFSRCLLVNGRADVALAAGADGVHLPADGVPIAPLRRRFGQELLLGRSVHEPGEVLKARDDGADYVVFGPVYSTPSKAAYGPPAGLAGLREAASHGLPVIAVGGIEAHRVPEVVEHGAWGIAAIRAFHDPVQVAGLVRRVRGLWSLD